jgi:hypothetical protein
MSVEPTPAPAAPPARGPVREWLAGLSTSVKAAGGLAGAAASVLALVFLLLPNLQPTASDDPKTGSAELSEPRVESPVSFAQYLDRVELPRTSYGEEQLRRAGALVSVEVAIKGYRGQALPMRWYLLDGAGDIADQQSRRHSLVADRDETPAVWPFWVALPEGRGPFRVVVEVYPPGAGTGVVALDKAESAPFGA